MKRKAVIVLTLLLSILLATGCGLPAEKSDDAEGKMNYTVEEAKKLIDEKNVEVIDVRTPEEYKTGHIPGTKLIPLDEIESNLSEFDPDKEYLLVCRSGNRSSQAREMLALNGIKHAYNMEGGMNAWPYEIVK